MTSVGKRGLVLLLCLALVTVGCGKKPQSKLDLREALPAKWQGPNSTIEFTRGGLIAELQGEEASVYTYTVAGADKLLVTPVASGSTQDEWAVELHGVKLVLHRPTGAETFVRVPLPAGAQSPLLGKWILRLDDGMENIYEFTPYGDFVATRWIKSRPGDKRPPPPGARVGESYRVGEAGTFRASGSKLTLDGFRRRKFSREWDFKLEGKRLRITYPKADGGTIKATYQKSES